MKAFKPASDGVLVRVLPTKYKGMILRPSTYSNQWSESCLGIVLATGPGRVTRKKLAPMDVKSGDVVCFNKYHSSHSNGERIKRFLNYDTDGDADVVLIKQPDVMFVIDDPDMDNLPEVD